MSGKPFSYETGKARSDRLNQAPLPLRRPQTKPQFVWPVDERTGRMCFFRGTVFIHTPQARSANGRDVRAAGGGSVIAVRRGQPRYLEPMFSIIIQHANGFLTTYGGWGNPLVDRGGIVETRQPIATIASRMWGFYCWRWFIVSKSLIRACTCHGSAES